MMKLATLCSFTLLLGLFREVNSFLPATKTTTKSILASTSTTAAEDLLPTIREGVADLYSEKTNEWEECVSLLQAKTNIDSTDVLEMAFATALNWKGWAMSSEGMRKFIPKPHGPDIQKLESALTWLEGEPLKLNSDQIGYAIQEYPRTYLVDPEASYTKSLSVAPDEYKDQNAFTELVLEDLQALGNTYNCADSGCASECGNCWVTYSKS